MAKKDREFSDTARMESTRNQIGEVLGLIFSRENLLALVIALLLIAIFITTAADAPRWVYQGF
jgi:preprotein translocase subunit SecF